MTATDPLQPVDRQSTLDEKSEGIFLNGSAPDEFRLIGDSLTLCDVRCGPTEDKQIVQLGSGVYTLDVEYGDGPARIRICRSGADNPSIGAELGEISIDGGVLGAYDTDLFRDKFRAQAEDFYNWGESLFDASEVIRVFRDSIEPYEFAYIPTFLDGIYTLTELTQRNRRIGVRLSASVPESKVTDDLVFFRFIFATDSTSVEVWLDPVFDDEDIVDSIADGLGEVLGQDVDLSSTEKFISEIESIGLAIQIDEELTPGIHLDLSGGPTTWKSNSENFCKFLRDAMLERRAS